MAKPDAGGAGLRREGIAIGGAMVERRQEIDAGVARESLGDSQAFRFGKGVGGAAAKGKAFVPVVSAAMRRKLRQSSMTAV